MLAFLLSWWLIPIVLFSLAQTKHEWYVLPSYVPAYILAAWVTAVGFTAIQGRLPVLRRSACAAAAIGLLVWFVGGKTLSRLLTRYPAEAAVRRAEMGALVSTVAGDVTHCDTFLFRAYELPAARFYLSRAGISYRMFEEWSLPAAGAQRSWCIVATLESQPALAKLLPDVRLVSQLAALKLVVLHMNT